MIEINPFLIWLTVTSEVALFVMGYVLGFVGGKRHTLKLAKLQNLSDLK